MIACRSVVDRALGLRRLLTYHLEVHPSFGVADLYKLFHQACLGPAHLGRSAQSFRCLLEEWERAVPSSGRMVEPICPRGTMVRLNLKPFKQAGGSVLALWKTMLECLPETAAGKERLHGLLRASYALAARGKLPLASALIEEKALWANEMDYPPGRHSEEYLASERPTYRVLPLQLLIERWPTLFSAALPRAPEGARRRRGESVREKAAAGPRSQRAQGQ